MSDKRSAKPQKDTPKTTPKKFGQERMAEKGQGSASKVSLKPKAETVCRFYEKGECRHGSDCPFLHPSLDEEYRAPEPEQHDSYEAKEATPMTTNQEATPAELPSGGVKLSNSVLANKLLLAIRPAKPPSSAIENQPVPSVEPAQQSNEIEAQSSAPLPVTADLANINLSANDAENKPATAPSIDKALQLPAIPPLPAMATQFDGPLQLPLMQMGPPPGILPMRPALAFPPWYQGPSFPDNFHNQHMMQAPNQLLHPGHFDPSGQQPQMWNHMGPPGLNFAPEFSHQMQYAPEAAQGYNSMMHMHPGAFRHMGFGGMQHVNDSMRMHPSSGQGQGWQNKMMEGDGRGGDHKGHHNGGFSHDNSNGDHRYRDFNRGNGDNKKSSLMASFVKSKAGEKLSKRQDRVDGDQDVAGNGDHIGDEENDAEGDGNVLAKRNVFFRNTKRQIGDLKIKIKNFKTSSEQELQNGFYMRPGHAMVVHWRLPVASLPSNEASADFVIALLRYGSQVNMPSIVGKSINYRQSSVVTDEHGVAYRTGHVPFFAPKAAGQFVFRLFDQQTKETTFETLATSSMYSVVLIDSDIVSNLQHVLDAFQDNLPAKAISQFTMIIRGIKSCLNNGKDCAVVLNRCVEKILEQINLTFTVLDEGSEKKRVMAMVSDMTKSEVTNEAGGVTQVSDNIRKEEDIMKEDEEFWKAYRSAFKIHIEAHDAMMTLRDRKTPWYLVTEKLKTAVSVMNGLYCPVLRRYFRDSVDLMSNRFEAFEFFPSSAGLPFHSDAVLASIERSMMKILPQLLPKPDFQAARERARETIERSLLLADILPPNSKLAIYGSSGNNFGNDDADLDMCLIMPLDREWTGEEKINMIEKIGDALTNMSMSEVSVRASARIPIVQFKDPLSKQECDISLYNSLALSNTRLLRIYSEIDPRVRALAYIIKHWAKRRHMNSPQDGTLSSYGYILTLLHFLQSRAVPIIPDLQSLPPNWNGPKFRPDTPEEQYYFESTPVVMERKTADGTPCNTYFLEPNSDQWSSLRRIASQNTESCASLLLEYFRYFAWSFDYRHSVVSLRRHGMTIEKTEKYERAAWLHTDNLSIEDPFETWYDVAHVIKPTQMTYIRKEYLRAFTLASRAFNAKEVSIGNESMIDTLPETVHPDQFLDILCEACDPPAFVGAYRKKTT